MHASARWLLAVVWLCSLVGLFSLPVGCNRKAKTQPAGNEQRAQPTTTNAQRGLAVLVAVIFSLIEIVFDGSVLFVSSVGYFAFNVSSFRFFVFSNPSPFGAAGSYQ